MLYFKVLIFLFVLSFSSTSTVNTAQEDGQEQNISFKCEPEDFKIDKLTVFQSIEAPQIYSYNKYDLVKRKTAVVLVDIKNNLWDKAGDLKTGIDYGAFSVSLNIRDTIGNMISSDFFGLFEVHLC